MKHVLLTVAVILASISFAQTKVQPSDMKELGKYPYVVTYDSHLDVPVGAPVTATLAFVLYKPKNLVYLFKNGKIIETFKIHPEPYYAEGTLYSYNVVNQIDNELCVLIVNSGTAMLYTSYNSATEAYDKIFVFSGLPK